MALILPKGTLPIDKDLYQVSVFVLTDQGQLNLAEIFPQPVQVQGNLPIPMQPEFKGASLTQIKKFLEQAANKLLDAARQQKECKIMIRVTEINKFKEEQRVAATMQNIQSVAKQVVSEKGANTNDGQPNEQKS